MNIKKWEVAALDKNRAAQIAEQYGIPFFLAMLLDIRGLSDQVGEMLYADMVLSDPFLMKDMDKAVARIQKALDEFQRIAVYGDYDADGVTATSILYTYLEACGADVVYYIPQREGEGYGMNEGAVHTLSQWGVKLIITVDNGISSIKEVELAKELGMDVVVTDHHRPQEQLPSAVAVVDAYREDDTSPFKDFSGAGLALKLLIALEGGEQDAILEEYADLAALGTIGDVVPMCGENRAIVKAGLELISRQSRPGLSALFANCSTKATQVSAEALSFTVIPRINATGRMGSPERAVKLLICDEEEEAQALAEEICADNEERRKVEGEIAQEAFSIIEQDAGYENDRVIVVSGKNWHHGVIGIVASRVTERYGKPCFVISEDGETAKGSGRSVEGFSLFQAISACVDVLDKFGGHPMAAGINLSSANVPVFREKINAYAKAWGETMPVQVVHLDCKLNPASLSIDMPKQLRQLEPFGNGNPHPLFGLFQMELTDIKPVGNGNHLRLTLRRDRAMVTCMKFGMSAEDFPYPVGSLLDLAVSLEAREFRGEEVLSIQVRDMRLSLLHEDLFLQSYRLYENYLRGESMPRQEAVLLAPTRDDLALLYKKLAALRGKPFGLQAMVLSLGEKRFNLGKLLLCLDVLEERGLIHKQGTGEMRKVELIPTEEKVDLFASQVFAKMRTLTSGERG